MIRRLILIDAYHSILLCLRISDDRIPRYIKRTPFASLFPMRGQPAEAPVRLALVTLLQFVEGLSDRYAADPVQVREQYEALPVARKRQTTEAFQHQHAARSGIESTHEQAIRRCGLRQSRYLGLAKPICSMSSPPPRSISCGWRHGWRGHLGPIAPLIICGPRGGGDRGERSMRIRHTRLAALPPGWLD